MSDDRDIQKSAIERAYTRESETDRPSKWEGIERVGTRDLQLLVRALVFAVLFVIFLVALSLMTTLRGEYSFGLAFLLALACVWLLKPKPVSKILVRSGIALVVGGASLAGLSVSPIKIEWHQIVISLGTIEIDVADTVIINFLAGFALIAMGAWWKRTFESNFPR